MSKFKVKPAAKPLLTRASRAAVEDYFVRHLHPLRATTWLDTNNRYRVLCTHVFDAEVKRARKPPPIRPLPRNKRTPLRAYVGASSPAHVVDGWSFLGRAVDATFRGDTYSAAHFAYYAELRAAMSLLASEGIGVFSGNHAIIEDSIVSYFPRSGNVGTHALVWPLLRFWASLARAGDLLDRVVQPNPWPLSTWLYELNCPVRIRAIGQGWMTSWGVDLATTAEDHAARNLVSYRPSQFRRPAPYGATNIANFVTDLWSMFEPSGDRRFHNLERHLLKLAWTAGGVPLPGQEHFEGLGFTPAEATTWREFFQNAATPLPLELATNTTEIDEATCHLRMISRASLLLFLASSSARLMLQNAGYTIADLRFWWLEHGAERGLWRTDEPPDDPLDTWADVYESLQDLSSGVHVNPNTSLHQLRNNHIGQIDILGAFERASIWSLLP